MNKRQEKKQRRNENILYGCSYREYREMTRYYHEYEIKENRSKVIPEDYEILIELGIYTVEEIYMRANKKTRWRQFRKLEKGGVK